MGVSSSLRSISIPVWITLGIVVVCSIAMRVHSLDRSFWQDEVWVVNAVVAPTFSQMVYYEGWLNTSPPLFLLLVRWTTQLFGVTHASMRLVPVLFGILSVPAMAYLALRLLQPWYALVAVALFSLSQDHIILTQSVKQYSTDAFVSLIFLTLGYHFLITRSRKNFYFAIIAFSICGFLSYQIIMFLPIFFYAVCFDFHNTKSSQNRFTIPSVG
ncbi:MAG: glycosyltransferase family 39 protein, partial [Acidobacteriota bacterium]